MPHPSTRRRRLTSDETHDRLPKLIANEDGGLFLRGPTDLADQHHRLGRIVVDKQPQGINETGTKQRVAADAEAGRLTER